MAVVITACVSLLSSRRAEATSIRLNVKDVGKHGLTLIAPTDPSFDGKLSAYLQGKSDRQRRWIEVLKPFSVFIKNSGKADIIAYALKWEIVRTDGQVSTGLSYYQQPGLLMGEGVPSNQVNDDNVGRRIRRNSLIFASWDPALEDAEGAGMSSGGSLLADADTEQVRQSVQNKDREALIKSLSKQLAQATSITVSIDGAFFEDGTFIGPDTSGFFDAVRAQVEAKQDMFSDIEARLERGESPAQVISHLESEAGQLTGGSTGLTATSTYLQQYDYWNNIYHQEILRMRGSVGDSKLTLEYALRPTRKAWPMLHKQKDKK